MSSHSVHSKMVRQPLELIHNDICGPMLERSLGGARYFITFVDDYICKVWAYSLKSKDKMLETFDWWIIEAKKRSGYKVKTFWWDNGDEYTSNAFEKHLPKRGIRYQRTIAYILMQNGVAKCMNWMIQERVMSMLQRVGLKKVRTAGSLNNLSPSEAIKLQVPHALWSGTHPNYDQLCMFGCATYAHLPREKRTKLVPHSRKCTFSAMGRMGASTFDFGT